MTKTLITAALLVAAPATAQTTTTCRQTVAGAPQFGITCDSQPQVQVIQPVQQPRAQLQMRNWDEEIAYANSLKMQQREMALREREMRVREAEAGLASTPAQTQPSTGRKLGRALFGF